MPDVRTTSETTAAGGALPPPDGSPATQLPASRKSLLLMALLALAGLTVGIVMTVFWLGVQGERDEAQTDRDLAVGERDAARGARIATEAELAEVRTDLTDTRAELDATTAELDATMAALAAAEAGATTDGEETADVAALRAEVADLEAAAARLADDNERLQSELDEALDGDSDDGASPVDEDSAVDETTPSGAFDPSTAPNLSRWVGELLTSRNGSSRLSETQAICFGSAVIDDIGLDALGAGQNNAASGAERQVVIDAMVDAGVTCGIDQSLIFN